MPVIKRIERMNMKPPFANSLPSAFDDATSVIEAVNKLRAYCNEIAEQYNMIIDLIDGTSLPDKFAELMNELTQDIRDDIQTYETELQMMKSQIEQYKVDINLIVDGFSASVAANTGNIAELNTQYAQATAAISGITETLTDLVIQTQNNYNVINQRIAQSEGRILSLETLTAPFEAFMASFNGGDEGQVLMKRSSAVRDYGWSSINNEGKVDFSTIILYKDLWVESNGIWIQEVSNNIFLLDGYMYLYSPDSALISVVSEYGNIIMNDDLISDGVATFNCTRKIDLNIAIRVVRLALGVEI